MISYLKRSKYCGLFFVLIFLSCNAISSNKDFTTGHGSFPPDKGSFNGNVLNAENGSPVSGALINLSNGMSMITDSQGHYFFKEINIGKIQVTVEADNYLFFEQNIYVYKNQDSEIDFRISPIPGPEITVTVATFNVQNMTNKGSYVNTAKFIKNHKVDIIVFEEIKPEDEIKLNTQLVLNDIFMPHVVFSNENNDDYIAVWSKHPISISESILKGKSYDPNSDESLNAPRYILRVKILIDTHEIWLYGCHLKASSGDMNIKKRRAQAHALEEYIKANHDEENENIIILGDMNLVEQEEFEEDGSLGYLSLKFDNPENIKNDFKPVNYSDLPHDDYTFIDVNQNYYSILDHIIISPGLFDNYVENSIDVIHPEGAPSDHYPALLKLSFELLEK